MPKKRHPEKSGGKAPFPTKTQILDYITDNPYATGKRDIARAFQLRGEDRVMLRDLLREMKAEGLIDKHAKGAPARPGRLPSVTVIEVSAIDTDGELLARPASWDEEAQPPAIILQPTRGRGVGALGVGDRVLARLARDRDGLYIARPIRRLDRAPRRLIGVYEVGDDGGRLRPCQKKMQKDYRLRAEDAGEAEPGDLVLAEVLPERRGPRLGLRRVRVVERLGSFDQPNALSLIAIHEQGIPFVFPEAAVDQAKLARAASPDGREDLRDTPLVTIDGADARDFDDAVHAEPDGDPKNPGGWRVLVAIADVAHYVPAGSELDQSARLRGNSVYFPDRVVPMLPEDLSNGWCSLKPGEERPCLAVWMTLDAEGNKRAHRFLRGLMRSAARLTYDEVQAAHDGTETEIDPSILALLPGLYGAFGALAKAREARGTLNIELPERQVLLDTAGMVASIGLRPHLNSHRLIEEFMIAANVAAAEELEKHRATCMYRVHEPPDPLKLEALAEGLSTFGLRIPKAQIIRPRNLNDLLARVAGRPEASVVNQLILRSQSQAFYSPHNLGHFGLALRRYAHFTSPIRRYSDLLVHRALISALGLGGGGLSPEESASFAEFGEHISFTERRAATAERDTLDRFVASHLAAKVGLIFEGRISSVTRFGLFVTLEPTGGDGLIPMMDLPDDYYHLDPKGQRLTGDRWGRSYSLGERLSVRLVEADPVSGTLRLALADDEGGEMPGTERPRQSRAKRKRNRRTPRK